MCRRRRASNRHTFYPISVAAVSRAVRKYPELIDYYIRYKEDNGEKAIAISDQKVKETEIIFIDHVQRLINQLKTSSEFYCKRGNTFDEAIKRVHFLKQVIENNDGYRIFYVEGMPVKREQDLQLIFRLTWYASTDDVNAEVNNGRGPVDYKISRGAEAQAISNESLNAAQAARATERAEAEDLRNEVSEAYEDQAQELETVRQQLAEALEQVQAGEQIRERQASELADLDAAKQQRDYEAANAMTELHTAREALDALRSELAQVQARADAQASVAAERQQDAVTRLETVLAELENIKQESRTALDKAQQEAAEAREHAAGLTGQLEAITAQNRELMDALKK